MPNAIFSPFTEYIGYSPDQITIEKGNRPPNELVLSRKFDGSVLSRYGDELIDLSPYKSTSGSRSKFNLSLIDKEFRGDARWLWYLVYVHGEGRNNNSYSVQMLWNIYTYSIRSLCDFSKANNTQPITVLADERLLSIFIHSLVKNQELTTFSVVMSLYHQLGEDIYGFKIAYKKIFKAHLNNSYEQYKTLLKQTPIIPPRIYLSLLNTFWEVIKEYEKYGKGIPRLIAELTKEAKSKDDTTPDLIRAENVQKWIKSFKLKHLSKKYFGCKRIDIVNYVNYIQYTCKMLVHFYSGMRDSEVKSLKYNCLLLDKNNKRSRARLIGNTTKYVGNKKQVMWATCKDIDRVIVVLQSIAKPIANVRGFNISKKVSVNELPCPLLLSTGHIFKAEMNEEYPNGKEAEARGNKYSKSNLSSIKITEEDVGYLEKFEPNRDWRNSTYSIGSVWPLQSHQCRRSLAVYSAQSGLVTIGALQTQLKHLCREITFYYANNAERASKLFDISDGKHMANFFNQQKPQADFTAWLWQMVFSDETLYGANGRIIEQTLKARTPTEKNMVWNNREETIKKFKRGELAFTETALGGCESITPCEKKVMRSVTACIDCAKVDIKMSKVTSTIDSYKLFISELPIDSVEYRTEKAELDTLVELKNRIKDR